MFGLHIVQDIISVHIRFSQNRIQTHLMVVKLARINHQVLQDDRRRLKVDSETFGSEIGRNWFTDLFLLALNRRTGCFPHFSLEKMNYFSFNGKNLCFL